MKESYQQQFVAANLRACQLKQLSILEEIDRICKKYNIPYWLDGGTLLGAIRHGGFIPWDDDIDIAMMQNDLNRFLEVAPKELPSHLCLQTPTDNEQLKEPITKIRDLNSMYIERGDSFLADYPKGLFVDIFPFIDYPTLPRKWVKKITLNISKSYSILHKQHYYSMRSFAEFFWFGAKYLVFRLIWEILCIVCKKGTYLSNVLHNNGYGIMHRKDAIFPLASIDFEGKPFSAPANVDAYLKDLYRNYMEVPPPEKRKIHAIYLHPELIPNHPKES